MSKENYYTNPFALYQELQDYNKNSPLLPPTVLSSKYPTILTDEPIQKNYHALTHANTSSDGYPLVKNAYTEDDPKYIVYQCQGGKAVRDFLTDPSLVMTPKPDEPPKSCDIENQSIVEGFQKTIDYSNGIKNLDITLFVHKKCPYSKKQLSTSFTKLMNVVHIHKRPEKQMFTDHGGFATPYFFSKKTNRSYTGYLPTVEEIYSTLSLPEKFTYTPLNYQEKVKDLDIQVYNLHGCPHCDNFKTLLRKNKLTDHVTMIDDMDKMEAVHEIKGWPTIKSRKTGKSMTGAPFTIDVLISYLS